MNYTPAIRAAIQELDEMLKSRQAIDEVYHAVVQELRHEGQCKLVFCGKYLEFEMDINSCDVYIDGNWVDSITHYSLVREFLEDIAECMEV